MSADATSGPAGEPGRRPKPQLSRACRGDDGIFAHEFCNNWNYVGGRMRYYCPCECHGDARYDGLLDPDIDLTTEPDIDLVAEERSEVEGERVPV